MVKRRRILWVAPLALLGLGSAAQAEEPSQLKATVEKIASRARPEVAFYYSRALAPYEYSDFNHSFGMRLALGALIDPGILVRASMSLDRELEVPIEAFRASNTTLTAVKAFEIEKVGQLMPTLFIRLPTNDEDREFLSYRGTFGANVGLLDPRIFTFGGNHVIGGSVSLTGARNAFAFTTSQAGLLQNRLWTLGSSISAVYSLMNRFFFTVGFQNNWNWTAVGRDNDVYSLFASAQYVGPYGLRFLLSAVTSDRTFQYDQVTVNVNLYKPENTMLVFTLAYTPQFDVLGVPR